MSLTQPAARRHRNFNERQAALRGQLFGDDARRRCWDRRARNGYVTTPRAMPLLLQAMDRLAGKDLNVSMVYLELWSRTADECFVEVKQPREFAVASGFSGQRAVDAWRRRMRRLQELGFIEAKPTANDDEFGVVLLPNPYHVVKRHHASKTTGLDDALYNTLLTRAEEIGATDLREDIHVTPQKPPKPKKSSPRSK